MRPTLVGDVMSRHLQTLDASDDLDLAEMIMRLEGIRHLPVMSLGRLVGLISHRDVLRAQTSAFEEADEPTRRGLSLRVKVREVMQERTITISPRGSLLEAARLMREHKIGSLPVLEDEELVGILTETDLLEVLIGRLKEESNATSG